MAVVKNPQRNRIEVVKQREDDFISNAGAAVAETEVEDSTRRAVVIRIPGDLLKRVDTTAKRKGLSRSSYIVTMLADIQNGER